MCIALVCVLVSECNLERETQNGSISSTMQFQPKKNVLRFDNRVVYTVECTSVEMTKRFLFFLLKDVCATTVERSLQSSVSSFPSLKMWTMSTDEAFLYGYVNTSGNERRASRLPMSLTVFREGYFVFFCYSVLLLLAAGYFVLSSGWLASYSGSVGGACINNFTFFCDSFRFATHLRSKGLANNFFSLFLFSFFLLGGGE